MLRVKTLVFKPDVATLLRSDLLGGTALDLRFPGFDLAV
jgi:hypothetical protein